MLKLSSERWEAARSWLFHDGRTLDQSLYLYLFAGGTADAVRAELEQYRNADGGFGHALEPDIRTPASSVIATTHAVDLLRRLGAGPSDPMLRAAIGYYVAEYDALEQRWWMVTAAVEDAPHAPWWTYADLARSFADFRINPTAAVVGRLMDYADLVPAEIRFGALNAVLHHVPRLSSPAPKDDLLCLIALAASSGLTDAQRVTVETRVEEVLGPTVVTDPAKWSGYCLTPLDVAPTPDAPFAKLLDRADLDRQLDWWIEMQDADGAWPLQWSWSQVDPDAWAQAERDWKGRIVVERLATLAAYGRIEP